MMSCSLEAILCLAELNYFLLLWKTFLQIFSCRCRASKRNFLPQSLQGCKSCFGRRRHDDDCGFSLIFDDTFGLEAVMICFFGAMNVSFISAGLWKVISIPWGGGYFFACSVTCSLGLLGFRFLEFVDYSLFCWIPLWAYLTGREQSSLPCSFAGCLSVRADLVCAVLPTKQGVLLLYLSATFILRQLIIWNQTSQLNCQA